MHSTAQPHGTQCRVAASAQLVDMAWIAGGSFRMGSNHHYAEERPAHQAAVDGFWIDIHPVTNAQFRRFVEATGYVTVAERPLDAAEYPGALPELLRPGALVFTPPRGPVDLRDLRNWWSYVPGAHWREPEGPGSTIEGRADHPVVHVAYADAEAYARWAGKELPSEAEWEFAARGGIDSATYCWGDEFMPGGRLMANTWLGEFPRRDSGSAARGTSAVGSFPANGYGLYDMTGNVWEWTADWYAPGHVAKAGKSCCTPKNPRGATRELSYDPAQPQIRIPRKVVKGGSFLCAANYCRRYRPAARQPQMVDSAMSHIGFRCVIRTKRS